MRAGIGLQHRCHDADSVQKRLMVSCGLDNGAGMSGWWVLSFAIAAAELHNSGRVLPCGPHGIGGDSGRHLPDRSLLPKRNSKGGVQRWVALCCRGGS